MIISCYELTYHVPTVKWIVSSVVVLAAGMDVLGATVEDTPAVVVRGFTSDPAFVWTLPLG